MALEWLDTHFIFTPEQLKKIKERTAGSGGVPLGPHGSARPNQQTIADLRDHQAPQVPRHLAPDTRTLSPAQESRMRHLFLNMNQK